MRDQKRVQVMIADDSAFMHSVIAAMLKDTEFEVIGQAKDGQEAIDLFKELRPQVLLLDIVMPVLTGPEVLEQILKISPSTRVLMVSSLGTEDMVVECLRKGAKHFLQKPVDRDRLLNELRKTAGLDVHIKTSSIKRTINLSFPGIITGKRFFGQYLLERGKITPEQLVAAVQYQKGLNRSLEQILLHQGLLRDRDLALALAIQKKNLDRDFARILLDEGFLTAAQLQAALDEQQKNRQYIGESMVKTGALTPDELEQELRNYKVDEAVENASISDGLDKAPHQPIVKSFIDYTIKIMHHVLAEPVKVQACVPRAERFEAQDYTVSQDAKGDLYLGFLLNLNETIVRAIATTLLGKPVAVVDDECRDVIKEFLNVIVGNTCVKLSTVGLSFVPKPPVLYDNRSSVRYTCKQEDEYMVVSLISRLGAFDILVKM